MSAGTGTANFNKNSSTSKLIFDQIKDTIVIINIVNDPLQPIIFNFLILALYILRIILFLLHHKMAKEQAATLIC